MAEQQIVIQHDSRQMQVAVLEDGRLAEYFVQRSTDSPVSGSIYCGVVESVLTGMQAAFIDIGWERNAYLALEDLVVGEDLDGCNPNIGDILKAGQLVVVQIKKEAVDLKGPKVSCKLSLPGRMLVLVPGKPYAAVSKKIRPESKRQALKDQADTLLTNQPFGLIVRTAGQDCTMEEFRQEFEWLSRRWQQLQQTIQQTQKPGLILADLDLAFQVIRDCAREDSLEGIYVNDFALYEQLQQQIVSRKIRFKIRWREEDLLERFQLYGEIRQIHRRKIWLKNGGYLVFDRTEALQVVDVNTGKFTGKRNFQSTIVQMNQEAAREIAWQIRLRNLSGIILIDFIDMERPEDQQQVLAVLEQALQQDRVKTSVLGMTQLGLVEMTRKKTRAPLSEVLEQPCPLCQERGRVDSAATIGLRIVHELEEEARRSNAPVLLVSCYPTVAAWLIGAEGKQLEQLEQWLHCQLLVRGDDCFAAGSYRITPQHDGDWHQQLPVCRGEILQIKIEAVHQEQQQDGIARLNGYIIQVCGGAAQLGRWVAAEVQHVMKTHAIASIIEQEVVV